MPGSSEDPNGPAPRPNTAKDIQSISKQFDQLDKNRDGVLNQKELQGAQGNRTAAELARLNRSLMFANIDPGNAAWQGLTKEDLNAIGRRVRDGEKVKDIAKDLQEEISADENYDAPNGGQQFNQWVDAQRQRLAPAPAPGAGGGTTRAV